ncbi:hypothetical protein STEG23_004867 [Scotinomys teguina]
MASQHSVADTTDVSQGLSLRHPDCAKCPIPATRLTVAGSAPWTGPDRIVCWNLPSSAFCKAVLEYRLGLFMVSQISWTFCVMTFLDLVFSLTVESIFSIDRSDPIWIPERLVRRVQETPRRQDEVSDADDAPVHPIAGTE